MKQILLLLSLYILTGCSANLGIQQIMKQISSESSQITKVISSKSELSNGKLKKQILGLSSFNGQSSKDIWSKIQTDVDFSKDNILIHTVRESSICDYDEKFIKKDAKQVDIMLVYPKNPNAICQEASVNYYLVYKVSKSIKRVGIKAFRHDYVVVDMEMGE